MTIMRLKNDIALEQIEQGLKVSQHDVTYVAEKWQLTPKVIDIITAAVEHGFDHLWVAGHPSKKMSHHIGFARDHKKPWEFLIGGEAKPPDVRCITVNNKLYKPLSARSDEVNMLWQNFGGKHLFIEPDSLRLRWLIELLKTVPRDMLTSGQTDRILSPRKRAVTGFQTEKHLEDFVYNRLKENGKYVIRQQPFASNKRIESASRPDLIVEEQDRIFIIELKLNPADTADLYQVKRYQNNHQLAARYRGKDIIPVLLTAYFDPSVQQEAQQTFPELELITYAYESEGSDNFRVSFQAESDNNSVLSCLSV